MFLAWREEKMRADDFASKLQEIKDGTPIFSVHVGDVKRYTIQSLISASEDELTSLEQEIEAAKKPAEVTSPSSFRASGALSGLFAEIGRMQKNLPDMMSSLGCESNADKLKRLRHYHAELLQHESKLKYLFQISLSAEATRYDKSVEIEVESDDTLLMVVDDDYETDGIPTTAPPDRDLVRAFADYRPRMTSLPGKYYLRSYAEDNKAFSELAYINASRPTNIFNSTYYIMSKQDKVNLYIKVHSTKLTHAQVLIVPIDLRGVPVINIQSIE